MNTKSTELTYDVVFNSETASDSKGFKSTEQYCRDYIAIHNGTNDSYFADYKNGMVLIVCNETSDIIYETEVK